MVHVVFTPNLQRHVNCPPAAADARNVREALDLVFAANPQLRSYVVDEQGRLRKHVNVYVNDRMVNDRIALSDTVAPSDEIFVFQALSGGCPPKGNREGTMSNILHVGTRKGLVTFKRDAGAWTPGPPAFIGQPVSAVLSDPRDGAIYAALRLGHFGVKLHRSDDRGTTWNEISAPAFPAVPNPDEKAPAVDMIWTLVAGGADEPGVLWAGTTPGGLFKSTDRGATWLLNEPLWNMPEREGWMGGGYDLPGIHSVLVDPRDSKSLTIGVSTGGVWRSKDGGTTWRLTGTGLRAEYMPPDMAFDLKVQDVHRLAACAGTPDIVWCQHHNGMFRSSDACETFTEIKDVKPAVFGFAVGAHPGDPNTAWFVPAIKDELRIPVDCKLVVTKTTDAGKTFAAHADGLPSVSYDLIYRHCLEVNADGTRIAIGSTTGNLWISDDAGSRWSQIHGHLSPIAAIAFG